jgi:hypothetical protein
MFLFADYWSQPKVGELAVFDFGKGADNLTYSYICWNAGDNRHFYQEDYHDDKWTSTWHMDYFSPRGIIETADEYPKHPYQFWTSYRTTSFYSGKEIFWGGTQKIGDEFNIVCQIDQVASTKFEAPIIGNQRVKFVTLYSSVITHSGTKYNDVLEIEYDQSWNGGASTGWRGWYARGIGVIRIIWRYKGIDVGQNYDATITTLKGTIKNKYPVLT